VIYTEVTSSVFYSLFENAVFYAQLFSAPDVAASFPHMHVTLYNSQ